MGEPTSFRCDSFRLYGAIHRARAVDAGSSTGVVLLNPGPTDRAGAHRFSIKLAERLAALGHSTIRFDPRGIGESEGDWRPEFEAGPILNVYNEIELGVWVPDCHAAIDHLIRETGVSRVVLGGVCGGAITALLAGADHPRVDGVFMIGNPITLSVRTLGNVAMLPRRTLDDEVRNYRRKLFRPAAWLRFITLKTDFRTLWGVLSSRARTLLPPRGRGSEGRPEDPLNPGFVRAFESAVRNRKRMLFVYSMNDYHWQEFEAYFLGTRLESARSAFELACIQDANHNLTEARWQDELYEVMIPWQRATASHRADP